MFKAGVADAAAVARNGYQAMMAGKTITIPGMRTGLSVEVLRVSPRSLARAVAARTNKH